MVCRFGTGTFIVVAGGIIGSRLSEQTLAFMAGVIFGGVTALPIGVMIGWVSKSPRQTDRAYNPPQPPIILTPPQAYPAMPSANSMPLGKSCRPRRVRVVNLLPSGKRS